MQAFRLVLNILWLLFCGIWMALAYALAALVCFVLIVTIPFGVAALRIAGYVLWPFGRTTVERVDAGAPSFVGNILWLVLFGWWLALGHLITSVTLAVTIIGIPFAWANLKLIPVSLTPLGREVVPSDESFGYRQVGV
ncbi:YccF domain-containing protein [Streptomyces sp. NBC_01190]|uniref:YccF domain-containing protein n=1 Tax=Streptomyces sp. NBC_01190 TaxID=2903767 RepID=UPI00386533A7|nr:YccF domain-containing protein [Streptomyces sp. NBC_01190]